MDRRRGLADGRSGVLERLERRSGGGRVYARGRDGQRRGGDFAAAVVDAAPPTYAPTFTAVYGEILSPVCAGPFCHGAGNEFLLMSSKGVAYSATVGVISHGPACADSGLTIVTPGDPDASLLYLKVTDPPCGNRMPAAYEPYLDARQTEQVRQWIATGALNN